MEIDPNITAEEVQDRIRIRAYEMWQAEAEPQGKQDQHWLKAEHEVLEAIDRSGATGSVVAKASGHEPNGGLGSDERQDELLDEAVEETFPASDPISPKQIT